MTDETFDRFSAWCGKRAMTISVLCGTMLGANSAIPVFGLHINPYVLVVVGMLNLVFVWVTLIAMARAIHYPPAKA